MGNLVSLIAVMILLVECVESVTFFWKNLILPWFLHNCVCMSYTYRIKGNIITVAMCACMKPNSTKLTIEINVHLSLFPWKMNRLVCTATKQGLPFYFHCSFTIIQMLKKTLGCSIIWKYCRNKRRNLLTEQLYVNVGLIRLLQCTEMHSQIFF